MTEKHNAQALFVTQNATRSIIQSALPQKLSNGEVREIMSNFVSQVNGRLVGVLRYNKKEKQWIMIYPEAS